MAEFLESALYECTLHTPDCDYTPFAASHRIGNTLDRILYDRRTAGMRAMISPQAAF